MCEFSEYVGFNKATHGQTYLIYKRDLFEGVSFSTAIFNSGIQLFSLFYPLSCFITVCPFVALLKA